MKNTITLTEVMNLSIQFKKQIQDYNRNFEDIRKAISMIDSFNRKAEKEPQFRGTWFKYLNKEEGFSTPELRTIAMLCGYGYGKLENEYSIGIIDSNHLIFEPKK